VGRGQTAHFEATRTWQIVYRMTDDELSVVSVFHGSRDPKIWKKRA
jgi:hypothetical protein